MPEKTVVIAGAGSGGLAAAIRLRELLGTCHRVQVIDQEDTHTYWGSFPLMVTGKRSQESICRPLAAIQDHGVEFIPGRIKSMSLTRKSIRTDAGTVPYDFLVIALGTRYDYDRIPGYRQHAYGFYQLSEALRLRSALASFNGGTITLFVASLPYKCEAAPWEMAMLLDAYFRRRSLRHEVTIQLITPETRLACSLQPTIGQELARLSSLQGIRVKTEAKVVGVGPDHLRLASGDIIPSDLSIGVPPHTGHPAEHTGGLANSEGWIPVEGSTLVTAQAGVWAIGDIAKIPLPVGKGWVPKSGAMAKLQGNVVADQLRAQLLERRPTGYFRARSACAALAGFERGVHVTTDFNSALPGVIYRPSTLWKWEKRLIEAWWLHRWF